MRYQTVKDIVEHSRVLHCQLGDFYRSLEDKSDQERVKMLLSYLSRHEDQFEESLNRFTHDASQTIWGEWFQFVPDDQINDLVKNLEFRPEISIDDVVSMALQVDDYFINLYRKLADNASSSDVRALFNNLLAMEELEKTRTVRSALELNDI